jgi:hypothetical protein
MVRKTDYTNISSPEKFPNIYLFNPTCEYAVANGQSSWQPNRLLQKMEEDLGTLPLFFARPNDVVLVKKVPPPEFLATLKKLNIAPPRFLHLNEVAKNPEFVSRPKNRLVPWGWSPAAHRLLEPLKPSCSEEFQRSPVANWKPEYREIYSKKFALQILKKLLPELPADKVLPPRLISEVCFTKPEIEKCINRWGKIMVKAPWSSSGRGLQKVTKTPVVEKVWEKLLGIINDQGYAIVEPFLEKVLDLAFEFELKNGKATYLGISRFLTDEKGRYQGNLLNGWLPEINPEIMAFSETLPEMIIKPLVKSIEGSLLANYYEGIFGVDMLIFRDETGNLRVNPCLEINVKQTMGWLSLQLEKLISPNKKGVFKTFYNPKQSFFEFIKDMEKNNPLKLHNSKIESGFFPLIPVFENTNFGAFILISD